MSHDAEAEDRMRLQRLVLQKLERCGAILKGHFVLTSGRHGDTYVNKDAVTVHPAELVDLSRLLRDQFPTVRPDVVASPAVGAIPLGFQVALGFSEGVDAHACPAARFVYADKDGDGFVFKRGFPTVMAGKRVLVVEDILTTGGSARKTVDAVRAAGGDVIAVAALCNRGGVTAEELGVPRLVTLANLDLQTWEEAECPLCSDQVPVNVNVGKGREFLTRKAAKGSP